jgi:hypothetical protein
VSKMDDPEDDEDLQDAGEEKRRPELHRRRPWSKGSALIRLFSAMPSKTISAGAAGPADLGRAWTQRSAATTFAIADLPRKSNRGRSAHVFPLSAFGPSGPQAIFGKVAAPLITTTWCPFRS